MTATQVAVAIVVATFWVTLAAHKSDISSAVFVEHTADL